MSEFEQFRRRDIPMPKTPADYAECYRANLAEARDRLRFAVRAVKLLRQAGDIYTDAETHTTRCKGTEAEKAWGDFVRWNSDAEHWGRLLAESQAEARKHLKAIAPDPRLPPEPDPEEEACPF